MKKILLFPLSNVLGHVSRTLAIAEEFDARGDEVHVVLSRAYGYLKELLPPRIRILRSPEMYAVRSGAAGLIASYEDSPPSDEKNLRRSGMLSAWDLRRRGRRMTQMLEHDTSIVEQVRPDALITDYRFTPALMKNVRHGQVFHIANILGYPSFFRRVKGTLPFPLDSGHILVPGIKEIEYGNDSVPSGGPDTESMCGVVRWGGWARMNPNSPACPRSNIFLFFGSTGGSGRIVPWLLRHLSRRYLISGVARLCDGDSTHAGFMASKGNLGDFLTRTELALCHGGHGTVMECIRNAVPMVIFPRNIEQLEIGRQVERLGLGIVMKRAYPQLAASELADAVEFVRTDPRIQANAESYASLLRNGNGAREAVSAVHRSLAGQPLTDARE